MRQLFSLLLALLLCVPSISAKTKLPEISLESFSVSNVDIKGPATASVESRLCLKNKSGAVELYNIDLLLCVDGKPCIRMKNNTDKISLSSKETSTIVFKSEVSYENGVNPELLFKIFKIKDSPEIAIWGKSDCSLRSKHIGQVEFGTDLYTPLLGTSISNLMADIPFMESKGLGSVISLSGKLDSFKIEDTMYCGDNQLMAYLDWGCNMSALPRGASGGNRLHINVDIDNVKVLSLISKDTFGLEKGINNFHGALLSGPLSNPIVLLKYFTEDRNWPEMTVSVSLERTLRNYKLISKTIK